MTLNEITACFPSIEDWEDAYLKSGDQRILAEMPGLRIEIVLEENTRRVSLIFDKVTNEIIDCLALVAGTRTGVPAFFEASSIFA